MAEKVIINQMLGKDGARAVTLLALMDILAKDLLTKYPVNSRGYNAVSALQEKIVVADKAIFGHVKDEFIDYCERFLAKVQLSLDGFWDEVSDNDMLDIRVANGKAKGVVRNISVVVNMDGKMVTFEPPADMPYSQITRWALTTSIKYEKLGYWVAIDNIVVSP